MGAEQSICAPGDGAGCCEARQADTIVRSQVRRTKGAAFSQVSLPFLAGLHTGAEAGAPTGHQQDATPLKPRTPVTPNASPGTPLSSPPSPWTPESQRTPGSPQTPRGGFYGASTPNSRRLENIKDKLKSLHKRVDVQLIVKKNDDIEEATGAAGRLLLHATRINSAAAPLAPEPLSIRELAKQVGSPRASRTTRQCARCLAVLGLGEMQRGECLACGTSTEIRCAAHPRSLGISRLEMLALCHSG